MHGKAAAKASMGKGGLAGDAIDSEVRSCQMGQTKGVAVGPDTSLGIAELLLSSVDLGMQTDTKVLAATRFIDDMEFCFATLADADRALSHLEELLNDVELQLNHGKTEIVSLPDSIEHKFITDIRRSIPSHNGGASEWIDYFNIAFLAAKSQPQSTALRYAISAASGVSITPKRWDLVQHLLWQCVALDAGTIRIVVDFLTIKKNTLFLPIDIHTASRALEGLINSTAASGHGSEVLWGIWAGIYLNVPISPAGQAEISKVDDSLVASAAMYARDVGYLDPTFESALWKSWLVDGCFQSENWLFAYEAMNRSWHTHEVVASKIHLDPDAAFLKSQQVTFIRDNSHHSYLPLKLLFAQGGSAGGY